MSRFKTMYRFKRSHVCTGCYHAITGIASFVRSPHLTTVNKMLLGNDTGIFLQQQISHCHLHLFNVTLTSNQPFHFKNHSRQSTQWRSPQQPIPPSFSTHHAKSLSDRLDTSQIPKQIPKGGTVNPLQKRRHREDSFIRWDPLLFFCLFCFVVHNTRQHTLLLLFSTLYQSHGYRVFSSLVVSLVCGVFLNVNWIMLWGREGIDMIHIK